ncbi:MAG: hypothetical protein WC441_02520 [Patescibacteria group bacterium]
MAAKFSVTGDQYISIDGQMLEIKRQIRLKGGSPFDPELVSLALQDIVEGKFHHQRTSGTELGILCLISKGETIIIDACDGSEIIYGSSDLFPSGIDNDFENWNLKEAGQATTGTAVQVYEMAKDATFSQMFGSLGGDLDKLCLTQAQIKAFCRKHANWLRQEGYGTFFLFKKGKDYFVACVRVFPVGLVVGVFRLGGDFVWGADCRHRVVVPQLMPSVS